MTRVFNTRIVFRSLGALLLIEAFFMGLTTLFAWWKSDAEDCAFLVSSLLTFLCGLVGLLVGRKASNHVGEREGYVIVALVWVVFSAFGMLPYYLSGAIPTLTDAWYETMSGFTTTGATILNNVEELSHSLLLWRSLTQWLGGLGIIVLCIALLPMFGLGGMQLYAAEVTGVNYEKLSPRIADTAKRLWLLYIFLTISEAVLLWVAGMQPFDSICHAFTTVATGGFSTKNLSIIEYGPAIQYIIAVYMLLSGINFALLIYCIIGKPERLYNDEETRWYVGAVGVCTVLLAIGLFVHYGVMDADWSMYHWSDGLRNVERAFRKSFFMVTSAMTSTGFAASDYMAWPKLLWVVVFFMMFTGASSGSTAGGIKWVRLLIFAKSGIAEFKRRIHPNAVIPIKLNNRGLSHETISNIMAFMMWYILIIMVTVLVFCGCGVNFDEAIGVTVSAIGNVGVSIGQYGPLGSYAEFPIVAKWWMTFVMLIGRLEIFTVLLLFTPALWKK
ncbi:MAG: TrkH family potassium uptake protein [Paludibacteraceae bacterium]|nr:TrkH family potassium uptake protein [Paludibacteraceae bacterium]